MASKKASQVLSKKTKSAPQTHRGHQAMSAKPSKLAALKAVIMGMGGKSAGSKEKSQAQAPKKAAPKGKKSSPAPAKHAAAHKPAAKHAPAKAAVHKPAAKVEVKAEKKAHAAPAKAAPAKAPVAPAKAAKPAAPTKAPAKGAKTEAQKAAQNAASSVQAITSARRGGGKPRSEINESVCREPGCEALATSQTYCRLHYIKNWKKIKRKEVILKEGKLNQYIEELVSKYPEKYIEAIRQDLANDKDFAKVIHDLDLDESNDDFDGEGESLDAIVGDIQREFDDDTDTGF